MIRCVSAAALLLGCLPVWAAAADHDAITQADLAQRAAEVRAQLGSGFTTIIERPFVVAGDEPEAAIREHARVIVRWSSDKLRADFFADDPDAIYAIYLFKDAASYQANAIKLFGSAPTTPYGYCSPAEHALVMNIATGGGTLVHEMVHAYMHGNVPACPDWINEGLASLFEQCGDRHGHIIGLVNWRLPVLQSALASGAAPSWAHMTGLPDRGFYADAVGANYGTARYIMYWLQEQNLLHTFWITWRAHRDHDASGLATLLGLFPHDDPAAVEQRWRDWVTALKPP